MTASYAARLDDFLRGREEFGERRTRVGTLLGLLTFTVLCGGLYGAVMGCFTGLAPGRFQQLIFSGFKVPLLLLVTYSLCLPSFFVVNTILGLRPDFRIALFAMTAMQSCIAVVLAALAPVTAFVYLCISDYGTAVLFNGAIFAIASLSSGIVVFRYYTPLIEEDPRHRRMLFFWLAMYVFVGIQAAWVMRPFIGNPDVSVAFFRPGAWGNAYIAIAELVRSVAAYQI